VNLGIQAKIGVVEKNTFLEDLRYWNLMTLAGRVQKPIKSLIFSKPSSEISEAIHLTREMAYNYASINLAMQDEPVTFDNILKEIISLSYRGDIRYLVGAEDPSKIDNILSQNHGALSEIYKNFIDSPSLASFPFMLSDSGLMKRNRCSSARMAFSQVLLGSPSNNVI